MSFPRHEKNSRIQSLDPSTPSEIISISQPSIGIDDLHHELEEQLILLSDEKQRKNNASVRSHKIQLSNFEVRTAA